MGNNGLIDPTPCFSLACCFCRPAAAPVAYKIQYNCSYSVQDSLTAERHWQGDCAAAEGCPSTATPRPIQALTRGQWPSAGTRPAEAAQARMEARSTHARRRVEDRSSRGFRRGDLKRDAQSSRLRT